MEIKVTEVAYREFPEYCAARISITADGECFGADLQLNTEQSSYLTYEDIMGVLRDQAMSEVERRLFGDFNHRM